MKERKSCVFCSMTDFHTYFQIDSSIFTSSIFLSAQEHHKKSIPYNILICKNCECYQNKYLGDLNDVYADNHNNIVQSDTWIKHYHEFFQFMDKHLNTNSSILEIGAGNNYLAKIFLKNGYHHYTVLEPVITERIENIDYVCGWLETYDCKEEKDITILSHVFEHLYEPSILFKVNTKYIAISVPNLPKYLENFTLNFLNIEHTFHFEENHIEIFFNNNQYKLIEKASFIDHSLFFIFRKEDCQILRYPRCILKPKFDIFFNHMYDLIHKVNTYSSKHRPLALFPGNMYIQSFYSLGLRLDNIDFFYDNNINKLDKYLYGTKISCKNLEFFIRNKGYTIILLGFLYNVEIVKLLDRNQISYYLP